MCQHEIACQVAESVVNLLKPIQVAHQQAHGSAIALRAQDFALQQVVKKRTGENVGEGIHHACRVVRLAFQRLLEVLDAQAPGLRIAADHVESHQDQR